MLVSSNPLNILLARIPHVLTLQLAVGLDSSEESFQGFRKSVLSHLMIAHEGQTRVLKGQSLGIQDWHVSSMRRRMAVICSVLYYYNLVVNSYY
jgi:hypothetical protein